MSGINNTGANKPSAAQSVEILRDLLRQLENSSASEQPANSRASTQPAQSSYSSSTLTPVQPNTLPPLNLGTQDLVSTPAPSSREPYRRNTYQSPLPVSYDRNPRSQGPAPTSFAKQEKKRTLPSLSLSLENSAPAGSSTSLTPRDRSQRTPYQSASLRNDQVPVSRRRPYQPSSQSRPFLQQDDESTPPQLNLEVQQRVRPSSSSSLSSQVKRSTYQSQQQIPPFYSSHSSSSHFSQKSRASSYSSSRFSSASSLSSQMSALSFDEMQVDSSTQQSINKVATAQITKATKTMPSVPSLSAVSIVPNAQTPLKAFPSPLSLLAPSPASQTVSSPNLPTPSAPSLSAVSIVPMTQPPLKAFPSPLSLLAPSPASQTVSSPNLPTPSAPSLSAVSIVPMTQPPLKAFPSPLSLLAPSPASQTVSSPNLPTPSALVPFQQGSALVKKQISPAAPVKQSTRLDSFPDVLIGLILTYCEDKEFYALARTAKRMEKQAHTINGITNSNNNHKINALTSFIDSIVPSLNAASDKSVINGLSMLSRALKPSLHGYKPSRSLAKVAVLPMQRERNNTIIFLSDLDEATLDSLSQTKQPESDFANIFLVSKIYKGAQLASHNPVEEERAASLGERSFSLVQVGSVDLALNILTSLPDPERSRLMDGLALELVKARMYTEAIRVAEAVPKPNQIKALKNVCQALIEAKEFDLAHSVARSLHNPSSKDKESDLRKVWVAMAQEGRVEQMIAHVLHFQGKEAKQLQSETLSDISSNLRSEKLFDLAIFVAERIPVPEVKEEALSLISESLARSGQIPRAIAIAHLLFDETIKSEALYGIIKELIRTPNFQDWEQAFAIVTSIPVQTERQSARAHVCRFLLASQMDLDLKIDQVLSLALSLADKEERHRVLAVLFQHFNTDPNALDHVQKIITFFSDVQDIDYGFSWYAYLLAKSGNIAFATTIAHSIGDESLKQSTLQSIESMKASAQTEK